MKEIIEYYSNGIIKEKGSLKDGLKAGRWLYYYESGNLCKEEFYLDGKLHGNIRRWFENGNIAVELEYDMGERSGLFKDYYPSGKIMEVGFYLAGIYKVKEFWMENGEQTLKDGTGFKIEKYGALQTLICKQYFIDYVFQKEEKIGGMNIIGFDFPET